MNKITVTSTYATGASIPKYPTQFYKCIMFHDKLYLDVQQVSDRASFRRPPYTPQNRTKRVLSSKVSKFDYLIYVAFVRS